MSDLKVQLQIEYERMRRIREATEQRLLQSADVEGKLRISVRKNQVMYYHRLPKGKSNGEYLPKKESELVQKLAQKIYDEKIMKLVTKREQQLGTILKDFSTDEIENLYLEEHPMRQELIVPVEPTWQQMVDQWMQEPYRYHRKPFGEDSPIILNNRKERVRSKSERTLSDYFIQHNIPYKYECPIFLKPYGVIYPDFTLLSKKTGKEVYWEHEGMMDNPEYARKAIKKLELYQENDILVGDQLILTFETSSSVLNEDTIEKIVEKYL